MVNLDQERVAARAALAERLDLAPHPLFPIVGQVVGPVYLGGTGVPQSLRRNLTQPLRIEGLLLHPHALLGVRARLGVLLGHTNELVSPLLLAVVAPAGLVGGPTVVRGTTRSLPRLGLGELDDALGHHGRSARALLAAQLLRLQRFPLPQTQLSRPGRACSCRSRCRGGPCVWLPLAQATWRPGPCPLCVWLPFAQVMRPRPFRRSHGVVCVRRVAHSVSCNK